MKRFLQLNEDENKEHLRVSKLNRQAHPKHKGNSLTGYRGKLVIELVVLCRKMLFYNKIEQASLIRK